MKMTKQSLKDACRLAQGLSPKKRNHPNRSKAPQFHVGQEVEVLLNPFPADRMLWRKAKIVRGPLAYPEHASPACYMTDLGVFDAEHIRAVEYAEPPAQWYDE